MATVKNWYVLPAITTGVAPDQTISADTQGIPVLCTNCPFQTPAGDFVCLVALDDTQVRNLERKPHVTLLGAQGDPQLQAKVNSFCDANGLDRVNLSNYDCAG